MGYGRGTCAVAQILTLIRSGNTHNLMFLKQIVFSFAGTEDDLEYYVRECGDILGVCSKLPSDCRDAKHILDYIFHQVVEFKKLNQVNQS